MPRASTRFSIMGGGGLGFGKMNNKAPGQNGAAASGRLTLPTVSGAVSGAESARS